MFNQLKDIAARQVGKVLASDATMKVLSSKQLKTVVVKAINLRAEARDAVEQRVRDVAEKLELVTRDDVASLKRSLRDLEDHVADLRQQLDDAQSETESAQAEAELAKANHAQVHPAAGKSAGSKKKAAATEHDEHAEDDEEAEVAKPVAKAKAKKPPKA